MAGLPADMPTKEDILGALKTAQSPVVICGAGVVGEVLYEICRQAGIDVACFCDGSKKVSQSKFLGKEVVHTPELASHMKDATVLISAAAIKDVVDLLHRMGIFNWFAGGLLLKDMDVDQSLLLDTRKFSIENCIACHEGYLHPDKLFIRSVDLIITERCSLRCKDCSNLMQYYQNPQNGDQKRLFDSMDRFFKVVDEIMDFRIIGGETFMNREWPVYVDRLTSGKKPGDPKIKRIVLYTNGTIVPDSEQLEHLKKDGVLVIATNYGPALSRKLEPLRQALSESGVTHHILEAVEWLDCALINPHHRSIEDNRRLFSICCAKNMLTLSDGKLFRCPYAANAHRLLAVPDYKEDYVDLYGETFDPDHSGKMKLRLKQYLNETPYLKTCDFCNGRPLSGDEVQPAIQAKAPLPYHKYNHDK